MRNHRDLKRGWAAALPSLLALASLTFASPVLASEATGEHEGSHGTSTAHAAAADTHDAHGAASHGPPQAEEVHNWFGFENRHTYPPIGWAIVNFVILLFLLVKFAGKPFRNYLRDRHEQIKKQLDEAAELRATAQQRLKEIESKVKNLDQEIAQIKKAVAADAEKEKDLIIAAAQQEAERIVANAERTMAEDVKRARRALEVEAVEAALAAAEKLLKQRVNESDHGRINGEYLTGLTIGGGN